MLRTFIMTLFLFLAAGTMSEAYSQSWLESVGRTAVKRAKKRAVERTEQKIYEKVDKAVDKAVDKVFDETEEAITGAAEKGMSDIEAKKDIKDSLKAAQKAEEKALELARKQKKSEELRQQVLKQFEGRQLSEGAPFCISREGLVLTSASKDARGKVTSYTKTAIVSMDYTDNRNFTIETSTELYSDEMELLVSTPMVSKTTVKDGVVTFDPKSMAGEIAAGMEINGDFFFIPDNIAVGDMLMDNCVEITIGTMTTTSESTNVHVSGQETLEISGYPIDCYIIESTVAVKAMGFKSEMQQKVWYGRGFGQVKTETYNSGGKLQSVDEIVEIKGL